MKKIILFALCAVLLLGGCGKKDLRDEGVGLSYKEMIEREGEPDDVYYINNLTEYYFGNNIYYMDDKETVYTERWVGFKSDGEKK